MVAFKAQPLADVVAVHVGKHQIEHDHIELAGLGKVDPFGAGRGDGDAMIFGAKPAVDEVGDPRLVFDEEDVHFAASAGAGQAQVVDLVWLSVR